MIKLRCKFLQTPLKRPEEIGQATDSRKDGSKLFTKFEKMKRNDLYRLIDLLEDIKKLDALILQHKNLGDSDFMFSQYEAKKTKLMGNLIDELAKPSIQSPESFSLIKIIIGKFYPSISEREIKEDNDLLQLAAAI